DAGARSICIGDRDYIRDLGSTANMSFIQEVTNHRLDVNPSREPEVYTSDRNEAEHLQVTVGASLPTGFEQTAADKERENLRSSCKISKD
ncbi:hypothetical protein HPG69_011442, partial [Diceros bicornis minor]